VERFWLIIPHMVRKVAVLLFNWLGIAVRPTVGHGNSVHTDVAHKTGVKPNIIEDPQTFALLPRRHRHDPKLDPTLP
jgi:hypothetical protein